MKKTISKTKYVLLALIIALSFSCSGDDGATGPVGPAGADGTNGTNGTDGTNGTNGNANVQTFTFDVSAESGSSISLNLPAITQDVLDNDVILNYLNASTFWYPIPGPGFAGNHLVRVLNDPQRVFIGFLNFNGSSFSITAGTYDIAKVIIIESTSTTAGRNNSSLSNKDAVLAELETAGVDVNNYYAVMDYYGLEY